MIDTIIFDFGDVFINLEKQAQIEAFKKLGISEQKRTLSIFEEDGDEIFIDELLETI